MDSSSYGTALMQVEGEKIGVQSIRLGLSAAGMTAIVGSFGALDRVLSDWVGRFPMPLVFDFQIVYLDGRAVGGSFHVRAGRTRRPTLMACVRRAVRGATAGRCAVVRGLRGCRDGFLDSYETDDAIPR